MSIDKEIQSLYPELHRRLVESGEWDRILLTLTRKLNETGWIDDISHQSKESAKQASPLQFNRLFADMRSDAETSVPLTIKAETETVIRQYLESQLEN